MYKTHLGGIVEHDGKKLFTIVGNSLPRYVYSLENAENKWYSPKKTYLPRCQRESTQLL